MKDATILYKGIEIKRHIFIGGGRGWYEAIHPVKKKSILRNFDKHNIADGLESFKKDLDS